MPHHLKDSPPGLPFSISVSSGQGLNMFPPDRCGSLGLMSCVLRGQFAYLWYLFLPSAIPSLIGEGWLRVPCSQCLEKAKTAVDILLCHCCKP